MKTTQETVVYVGSQILSEDVERIHPSQNTEQWLILLR